MASLCRRSASGFIASVAGPSIPSKLPIQATISSRRIFSRFLSTRTSTTATPSSPPRSPIRPRPASPFAPSSPARPPVRQTPITPTTAAAKSAWPWRPSPNAPAGYTDLERTIYARPYEGPLGTRVRMLWFLVPFWGLVVGFYLTTPSPPPQRLKGEDGKEIEAEVETPQSVLWNYTTPVLMFGTSLICFVWLYAPTRFVTRLTQVRRQAITTAESSSGEVKDFIRFQHGGHLMAWGNMPREREVDLEEMKISLIGNQVRSPYLSLRVTPKQRISFDSISYRMDFRDTAVVKDSEEEVVLSLSRIEHVFGKLR